MRHHDHDSGMLSVQSVVSFRLRSRNRLGREQPVLPIWVLLRYSSRKVLLFLASHILVVHADEYGRVRRPAEPVVRHHNDNFRRNLLWLVQLHLSC